MYNTMPMAPLYLKSSGCVSRFFRIQERPHTINVVSTTVISNVSHSIV